MTEEIINTDDYFYEITDESRGTIGYSCVSYKTAELIRRIHKQNKQLKRLEQENKELKEENIEYDEELAIEKLSHKSDLETLERYRSALEEIKEMVSRHFPGRPRDILDIIDEVLQCE